MRELTVEFHAGGVLVVQHISVLGAVGTLDPHLPDSSGKPMPSLDVALIPPLQH
jgi:hypothetical protein